MKTMFMRSVLLFMLLSALTVSVFAQDTITLRVWDTYSESGANAGMEMMIERFEAANPNIQIERDVQTIESMNPVIRTALSGGTGPDVFYFDTGPGYAGVLAEAGLLLPLTNVYTEQGWDHIFEWTKARTTFGGEVYGVSNELEFLGSYYNQAIFEELGLSAPTTYDEFLAMNEALKAAGYIPISFGDQEGWPAFHLFSIYVNNLMGLEDVSTLLFEDGSWEDERVVQAIQSFFVDMNQAGYLIPEVTAVNYDDSAALFYNGIAATMITGTWLIDPVVENVDFPVGWFFVPSPVGDPLPPAGVGSGYFINAQTEHPDEAIAFIDFLFDTANADIWMEEMSIVPPYGVDTSEFEIPELLQFAVEALATTEMGYNIDVVTPENFNEAMLSGFQAVLLGQRTPEEQAALLQAEIEEFRAS
jgi:raffinose/stachyose/melibiose transport system substrate-binding protein